MTIEHPGNAHDVRGETPSPTNVPEETIFMVGGTEDTPGDDDLGSERSSPDNPSDLWQMENIYMIAIVSDTDDDVDDDRKRHGPCMSQNSYGVSDSTATLLEDTLGFPASSTSTSVGINDKAVDMTPWFNVDTVVGDIFQDTKAADSTPQMSRLDTETNQWSRTAKRKEQDFDEDANNIIENFLGLPRSRVMTIQAPTVSNKDHDNNNYDNHHDDEYVGKPPMMSRGTNPRSTAGSRRTYFRTHCECGNVPPHLPRAMHLKRGNAKHDILQDAAPNAVSSNEARNEQRVAPADTTTNYHTPHPMNNALIPESALACPVDDASATREDEASKPEPYMKRNIYEVFGSDTVSSSEAESRHLEVAEDTPAMHAPNGGMATSLGADGKHARDTRADGPATIVPVQDGNTTPPIPGIEESQTPVAILVQPGSLGHVGTSSSATHQETVDGYADNQVGTCPRTAPDPVDEERSEPSRVRQQPSQTDELVSRYVFY